MRFLSLFYTVVVNDIENPPISKNKKEEISSSNPPRGVHCIFSPLGSTQSTTLFLKEKMDSFLNMINAYTHYILKLLLLIILIIFELELLS
jgi:hypothetical protein